MDRSMDALRVFALNFLEVASLLFANPKDKAQRVAHYASNLMHEVETIAYACGVAEPRLLDYRHAQVISETGIPEPMEDFIFGVASSPRTPQV